MQRRIERSMSCQQLTAYRANLLATLMLLVAQFLLGMAVNLFVVIPRDHPGSNPPEYFSGVAQSVTWAALHGNLLLVLHVILGLLLVFNAVGLLVRAIQFRSRGLILTSSFGALGMVAAGLNGGSYLNYHEDFSSMFMSVGFALAVAAYLTGLYLLPRNSISSENQ